MPLAATYGSPIRIDVTSQFAFGASQVVNLPGGGYYIAEAWLEATLAATTTGTYVSYPGLSMISRIVERQVNDLGSYAYQPCSRKCAVNRTGRTAASASA